ncbi:hypothetical protein AB8881_12030 [Alphaproteobacteria bacterium LSUCC0396]
MSRTMWILLALMAVLSISMIWRDSEGKPAPSWTLCKESLFTQIFTGACTMRFKGETTPS